MIEQTINTQTSVEKYFQDMFGVFAEFETIFASKIKELRDSGMGVFAIAKETGVKQASVFQILR